ncbi:RNA polymerase, sigma-24 subunit, ECF subfamily [Pseudopedobacter saltans DSM 12145]|uniref:RNA polymerase, sigma-24 subunit, ECF subfamily n=1 Tax=Pseudopedobacter saltans (strain ATCC 51119 / DSM 12145 / JCM 21818 / CCUG 39354 / LMG 10337 / NBRC 100064 / NCIMB 13643) TaxID=762903 RepID=F0S691_PSESL|nr:RNA polymerase sigma-70 factor [Pseudopedobacter saltans]ADY53205.1 RNA polymerase, sigma-24 subunit, ECF subfamily [Pseudopedobacter saltans DSM 12145]
MRNLEKLSDNKLAVLLCEGSDAAFEEIFNRYWSALYAAAYKRLKSHEKAEETVQDLFTHLWTKRKCIKIHTSLAAYLHTAIRYMVFNNMQKEGVRESYRISQQTTNSYDNSTEETILINDLNKILEKEVNHLPPKCRSVYELSRKHYKTNREIAAVLGISEKTVEGHLTKAIRQLKIRIYGINKLASWLIIILSIKN